MFDLQKIWENIAINVSKNFLLVVSRDKKLVATQIFVSPVDPFLCFSDFPSSVFMGFLVLLELHPLWFPVYLKGSPWPCWKANENDQHWRSGRYPWACVVQAHRNTAKSYHCVFLAVRCSTSLAIIWMLSDYSFDHRYFLCLAGVSRRSKTTTFFFLNSVSGFVRFSYSCSE